MDLDPRVRVLPALPGARLAWLRIPEHPAPARLAPEEQALFATLTAERRRAEWWSGRVCAQASLHALGFSGVAVLADPRGVPRLTGPGAEEAHVSISHGRRIAAAVATGPGARFPSTGVDVVDREDDERIRRIAYRVLTDREKELVEREPDAALLAWGTREAIAKATSTGMFMFALSGAPIEDIDRAAGRVETGLAGFEVHFEPLEDGGVLVLAGATEEATARARRQAGL